MPDRSYINASRGALLAWPRTIFCCAALAFVCAAPPAAATDITGFLPAKGEGTVALGYTDESYDEFWRGEEKRPLPATLEEISNQSTSLWLSWGLTDRIALLAATAYVETAASGPSGLEDSGPQDLSLLLAARLWRHQQGRLEHSLVAAAGVRTALESYVADSPVARGDETTDGLLRLVYLLRSGRFYWSQQVGFDLRSDEAPDGFPLYTELGWSAGRFTMIASYARLFADGGTDIGDPGFTFPSNQEEFERVGAKLIAKLHTRWALFAGGFTTLDGRNAGNADGLSFGIIHKF